MIPASSIFWQRQFRAELICDVQARRHAGVIGIDCPDQLERPLCCNSGGQFGSLRNFRCVTSLIRIWALLKSHEDAILADPGGGIPRPRTAPGQVDPYPANRRSAHLHPIRCEQHCWLTLQERLVATPICSRHAPGP